MRFPAIRLTGSRKATPRPLIGGEGSRHQPHHAGFPLSLTSDQSWPSDRIWSSADESLPSSHARPMGRFGEIRALGLTWDMTFGFAPNAHWSATWIATHVALRAVRIPSRRPLWSGHALEPKSRRSRTDGASTGTGTACRVIERGLERGCMATVTVETTKSFGKAYCTLCTRTVDAALTLQQDPRTRQARLRAAAGQRCPRCAASLDAAFVDPALWNPASAKRVQPF